VASVSATSRARRHGSFRRKVCRNGDWRLVGDVSWKIASGFSILVEGVYSDIGDVKTRSGMLRFPRVF
jgi:hypothetical protein